MGFIDVNSLVKFKNLKAKPKIGRVIDNDDPEKKGKIKVALEGLFDPVDGKGSNLPWIKQYGRSFKGIHEFSVPEVNSLVEIVWPFGSRIPMYKPAPYDSNGFGTQFSSDYPNEWGWVDSGGFAFKINKDTNEFLLQTKGVQLTGDTIGNFKINNGMALISIDSGGNITINGGKITLSGTTTIEGRKFLEHTHSNGHQAQPTGGVI